MLAVSAAAGLGLLAACGEHRGGEAGATGGDAKAGGGADPGASGAGSPSPSASSSSGRRGKRTKELPRGGRKLFPRHRLVGYCGLPGATALGRLGVGDPARQAAKIEKVARDYATDREPLPVLELLATIATSDAGPEGKYRSRTSPETIHRFHELAREHDAMLLLNVQPGRADTLEEVKALREWLVHPDVGVAVDPEWDMGPGQVPGKTYGRTSGGQLTRVSSYLSDLVREHDLPEKPLVFHQVSVSVVPDQAALRTTPGVAMIKSADGIGSPDLKRQTWRHLVKDMPDGVRTGFKLFYDEDTEGGGRLMSPKEVLALRPRPDYVMYE